MNKTLKFVPALVALALSAYATQASAEVTWYDLGETSLSTAPMQCRYVSGSVRNVSIVDYDNSVGTAVVSARYDFRCGDTTYSDTASLAYYNGQLTCRAYAWYGERCTLGGDVVSSS